MDFFMRFRKSRTSWPDVLGSSCVDSGLSGRAGSSDFFSLQGKFKASGNLFSGGDLEGMGRFLIGFCCSFSHGNCHQVFWH